MMKEHRKPPRGANLRGLGRNLSERSDVSDSTTTPLEMVTCYKCGKSKLGTIEFFPFYRGRRSCNTCKPCIAEAQRRRYLSTYRPKRKTPEARERARIYANEYRARNPHVRVKASMATRLWKALKSGKAGRSWESVVGYGLADLVAHLEELFVDGMTWDNYGEWHIDHKRPVASFEHSADGWVRECWALDNLQPLWALDNQRKSDKCQEGESL